jgi:hypothetical protein
MIGPPRISGDAVWVTLVANDLEGWKLATLAFIVGLKVAAGVVTPAVGVDTLGNCGAAAELAIEAICSEGEDEDEACVGDTIGCSFEEPVPTFLTADLFAILPGFADDSLASDEAEASVRPETLGAVIL